MGTRATHQRNAANRTKHREFAALRFKWVEQVGMDGELPKLAYRIAIWLCRHFNLDHDGAAWAYQDSMAQALGAHRQRVSEALKALVERGHLTSKQRGRDAPNVYEMVILDVRKSGL